MTKKTKTKNKKDLLSKLDLFGYKIEFNFNNRSQQTNKVGGIMTIILILTVCPFFCIELVNLIVYHNPRVVT